MQLAVEKQNPRGNDRKKGNGKYRYKGLSTALRFGRDDEMWVANRTGKAKAER